MSGGSAPAALVRLVTRRRPVVWVGAGASIAAGLPSAWQLATGMWDRFGLDPRPALGDAYALVDAFHARYGGGELEDALSHLVPTGVRPAAVHHAVARLAARGRIAALVTTNYDRLLEHALDAAGVTHLPQVLDRAVHLPDDGRLRLLKVHGDLGDWRHVVLTGRSYAEFADRYRRLVAQLDLLLVQRPLLFVGCSLLDERILGWVEGLTAPERDRLKVWFALLTPAEIARLDTHRRPSGATARAVLDTVNLRILELPDHAALPRWLDEAARAP